VAYGPYDRAYAQNLKTGVNMVNTNNELREFQTVVSNWQNACKTIDKFVSDIEESISLQEPLHDIMLEQVSKILVCEIEDLIQDNWFWLEWEPTVECFYYIYGVARTNEANRQEGPDYYKVLKNWLDRHDIDEAKLVYTQLDKGDYRIVNRVIVCDNAPDYIDHDLIEQSLGIMLHFGFPNDFTRLLD
jgi:hypothetical protein